ncbi:hypothetical protein GCK32_019229 [Trichostrongylus colubriformis]|uniref:Uncharacterized protein n=1 Tax=Trichostrongylus colubriformis TaxID=6319 RepID=A0AAN8FC24_TRICO
MNTAVLFALISALLSTALCIMDCFANNGCEACHDWFKGWHRRIKYNKGREKYWRWIQCGTNDKTPLPCHEVFCKNWPKNFAELTTGKDVNKFCKSMEFC